MGKKNGVKSNDTTSTDNLLSKQTVTNEYILESAVSSQEDAKLVIALSSHEIVLFDINSRVKTSSFKGHTDQITGVRFSQESPYLFLTSSTDGNIFLWDIRTGIKPNLTFLDDSDGPLKPFLCFDINKSGNFICGGTELIREDAFIIFWDFRTSKNLGGYWNSHTADVSHVQFSETSDSNLASSSLDGLINLYDLRMSTEDDALVNTLNTDSTVDSFSWGSQNRISCITGSEGYQFWNADMTGPIASRNRTDISEEFKLPVDYIIETFVNNDSFYLATGSLNGTVQLFSQQGKNLNPICNFENGHKDAVRTVCYAKENVLITGGEDGNLCLWKITL